MARMRGGRLSRCHAEDLGHFDSRAGAGKQTRAESKNATFEGGLGACFAWWCNRTLDHNLLSGHESTGGDV